MRVFISIFLACLTAGCQSPGPLPQKEVTAETALVADEMDEVAAQDVIQSGWVEVEFDVSEEGKVENAVVSAAHPKGVFDKEALIAVKRWLFKPKMVDGRPVRRRAMQRIEFSMDPSSEPNPESVETDNN